MSTWGERAEEEARRLAGHFGVADFVYDPKHDPGSNREVGDGILAVGKDGLVVQVKAREPEKGRTDSPEKVARWIRKNAAKAKRQADGTRRWLNRESIDLESVRGYERLFRPPCAWNGVVLLDHPNVPEALFLPPESNTMWITLDDWFALHERLRSTAAVIEYVDRVLESEVQVALGQERVRYDMLLEGDVELARSRGTRPRLPPRSLTAEEALQAAFFDEVIDLVHDKEDAYLPWRTPDEYRLIVEVLDRIPPGFRADVGAKLQELFLRMVEDDWWVSSFLYDRTQGLVVVLAFDSASNWERPEQFANQLGALTAVRLLNAEDDGLLPRIGLGVGILDHGEGGRSRWYTYIDISGDPIDVPTDIRYDLETRFGVLKDGEIVRPPAPGRNESCPCGSGRKYKRCHGSPSRS